MKNILLVIAVICLISAFYSCEKETISNEDILSETIDLRTNLEAACSKNGKQKDTLNLSDIPNEELKKGKDESYEEFLERLGFEGELCKGSCTTGSCTMSDFVSTKDSKLNTKKTSSGKTGSVVLTAHHADRSVVPVEFKAVKCSCE